jgi:hypothetical protein
LFTLIIILAKVSKRTILKNVITEVQNALYNYDQMDERERAIILAPIKPKFMSPRRRGVGANPNEFPKLSFE